MHIFNGEKLYATLRPDEGERESAYAINSFGFVTCAQN